MKGIPTYKARYWNNHKIEGLLMNSRMVQGIFNDKNPSTAIKWVYLDTKKWDADRNTDAFVAAMEDWYDHGLISFTVNLQGGSPMGYGNQGWYNSAKKKSFFVKLKGITGYKPLDTMHIKRPTTDDAIVGREENLIQLPD